MIQCTLNDCKTTDDSVQNKLKVFVDQDGTLADFDAHFANLFGIHDTFKWKSEMLQQVSEEEFDHIFWHMVETIPDFWETIPPVCEYNTLWETVEPFKPVILTAVPNNFARINAIKGKTKWVDHYIGGDVPIIFTDVINSRISKKEYCKGLNYLLIDDNVLLIDEWRRKGGIAIHHQNDMAETIKNVKEIISNYEKYERVYG